MMNASATGTADPPRPFFVPAGLQFDELPKELQAAVVAIINPAYRQLVLEASDGLERSGGVTVVHLLWLEVLDQLELAKGLESAPHPEASEERAKQIDRHLRLIGAKSKASHFLLRLKEFRRKWTGGLTPLAPLADPFEMSDGQPEDWAGG